MKKTNTIKTTWDLSLIYKHENDPQIPADLEKAEKAFDAFSKKYSGRTDYLKDEALLEKVLEEFEKLYSAPLEKAYAYFRYRHDLNSKDSVAQSQTSLLMERVNKSLNKIVFFRVALSGIGSEQQKRLLASERLKPYQYFLKCIFDQSAYTLSEAEEKVLNMMGLPAYYLWVQGNEKIISNQTVTWHKKEMPVNQAISEIASLQKNDRDKLADLVNEKLKSASDFAENELNAVVINKKIEDELRGYKKPYSATVLAYQNEEATVENLVTTVTNHFTIAHRFYKLKAKMLGLKMLAYSDRNANVGKTTKKIPFEEGVNIVREAFTKFGPEYTDIFAVMLKNGQIDVFPKKGKQGGAYCSSYQNLPTFVMLNHTPNFQSVTTVAHEMGHAFHAKFSNNQRPLYKDHTITTAEVASTFFENFVFDQVFPLLSPKEQIVALHDKIGSSINSIFRQVACFNFEVELHTLIRQKGSLEKEEMAKLMNKHMKSYLGPVFNFKENDGYFFAYWSHLRRFFYVYSYAFGELVSNALYEMYSQDHSFKKSIEYFLSAGGSDSTENIFSKIGINVRKPEFFSQGLAKIKKDIDKLERLIA